MDNFFWNKVIVILSPQPWNYLFISKHHYALELSRSNKVFFIGPPSHGKNLTFSCIDEINHTQLKVVTYTIPSPDWLRFKLPWLYKKIVRFYLKKVLKTLVGKADVCFDFGCYQQFNSLDFISADFKIFFPVDDFGSLQAVDRGSDLILTVSKNVQAKYPVGKCHFINHGLSEEFSNRVSMQPWNSGDKIRVGCSGNLFIRFLDVETLKALIMQNPSIEFHFFGSHDADLSVEWQLQWNEFLHETPNVKLRGQLSVKELARAYDDIDIFLLCYRPDNKNYHGENSHKVLEYLSTGKTIVSSHLSIYNDSHLIQMSLPDRNDLLLTIFLDVVENLDEYNSIERREIRIKQALENTYEIQLQRISKLMSLTNVYILQPKLVFISLNSISATPVFRLILNGLDRSVFHSITICECFLEDMSARFQFKYRHNDVLHFKDAWGFNHQSLIEKMKKYRLIVLYLFKYLKKDTILYTNDLEILALSVALRWLAKTNCRIVYHQFEAIEREHVSFAKRISLLLLSAFPRIELAIFPERNRLNLFLGLINNRVGDSLVFPNTCYPKTSHLTDGHSKDKFRIGHIGNLSLEAFFLKELADAVRLMEHIHLEFIFVGIKNKDIENYIRDNIPNATVIGWLDHETLGEIYMTLDVGLVLYKPVDFNTDYCAPNKLYEYWSYGVPVIAPNLKGLVSVFDSPLKGKLVDFYNYRELAEVIQNWIHKKQNEQRKELIQLFNEKLSIDIFIQKLQLKLKELF